MVVLELDFGPKTLAIVLSFSGLVAVCIAKRLLACCLSSQRSKLRDSYEHEMRARGQMTNQLLLPRGKVQFDC